MTQVKELQEAELLLLPPKALLLLRPDMAAQWNRLPLEGHRLLLQVPEVNANVLNKPASVRVGLLVHLVKQEKTEKMEHLDKTERLELLDLHSLKAMTKMDAFNVKRDLLARLDPMALQAAPALMETQEAPDQLVKAEFQDLLAQPETKDQAELQELLDPLETQEHLLNDLPHSQDQKGHQDRQGPLETQGKMALNLQLVNQVPQVQPELRVHQETTAQTVSQERREMLVLQDQMQLTAHALHVLGMSPPTKPQPKERLVDINSVIRVKFIEDNMALHQFCLFILSFCSIVFRKIE